MPSQRSAPTPKTNGDVDDAVLKRKVDEMVARLKRYHTLGREGKSAKLSTSQMATKHGIGLITMRKIRAFARAYTVTQLNALCKLRRPNGLPLHWGYIPYLLTVVDLRRRAELQNQVALNGWTAPELFAATRSTSADPQERKGGRPRKSPRSLSLGLKHLAEERRAWLNRYKELASNLPASSRRLRERAILELETAAREATELARQLKRGKSAQKV